MIRRSLASWLRPLEIFLKAGQKHRLLPFIEVDKLFTFSLKKSERRICLALDSSFAKISAHLLGVAQPAQVESCSKNLRA